jgi:hypothetical protein
VKWETFRADDQGAHSTCTVKHHLAASKNLRRGTKVEVDKMVRRELFPLSWKEIVVQAGRGGKECKILYIF